MSSPANYNRAFGHGDTGLAVLVHFGQQLPEHRALCFWAIVFHCREAYLFGRAEMGLPERSVECTRERIGSGKHFLEPCALEMPGEIGRPPLNSQYQCSRGINFMEHIWGKIGDSLSSDALRASNNPNMLLICAALQRRVCRHNFEGCWVILNPLSDEIGRASYYT